MIVISIGAALICFSGLCYPVLVGENTPVGEYQVELRTTQLPGYGGDVLLFKESKNEVFAIHRIVNFNPLQKRLQRISSPEPRDRIITDGCVNVMPDVYDKLIECCSTSELRIQK